MKKFGLISLVIPWITACNMSALASRTLATSLEARGVEQVDLEIQDHRLHYWVAGEGPPIFLLHGFG